MVQQIAGYKNAIKDCEYQLSSTHARMAVLDESGVKETKIRQIQHSEFVTLTDNNAALGCLDGVRVVQSARQSEIKTRAGGNTIDSGVGRQGGCRDPKSSWRRTMLPIFGRTNVPSCLTSTELALWQAFTVLPKILNGASCEDRSHSVFVAVIAQEECKSCACVFFEALTCDAYMNRCVCSSPFPSLKKDDSFARTIWSVSKSKLIT